MGQDLISIITPVYNAGKNLSKMLDSVLAQTYTKWELILVNDGSTDSTEKIIKEYVENEPRIRSFHQSNAGPSVARNRGIEEAKGIYLSFIDADDWVSPDYLKKLIEPMLRTETDLVCAGYYEVNPKFPKGLKLHDFKEERHNHIISKKEFQSNLFNGVCGVLWAKLFKKEIFTNHQINLHPELRLSEDLIAVLAYSTFIKKSYIISDSIYYYNRLEEGGLSGVLKISNYKDLKILLKEIEKYRKNLSFLDLDTILNKRKYAFMTKLLTDRSGSQKEFYKIANFLVQNESPINTKIFQNHTLNDTVLRWIFSGKHFQAWILLKAYTILRKMKHG